MTVRLKQRQKKYKVHKHISYGRTYNHKDGIGYEHYTKGYRKSSITTKLMDAGGKFLNALIERAFPKPDVKTPSEASEVKDTGDVV